jgi:integrase
MAVPKEFIHSDVAGLSGLKANKDYTRFRYRTKIDGKEVVKVIDYTKRKSWTPKVKRDNARKEAEKFREDKQLRQTQPFNPDSKVDFIANEYFDKKCTDTDWTKARTRLYELYIKPFIGNKKISTVREHSIDTIRKNMETTNHHQYKQGGSSVRSIEKVLYQTLKPILMYAQSNGAIDQIPPITIPNRPKKSQRKKRVSHASDKLITLHRAIHERYSNDPFYRAMFLFALNGRRWGEIKTLRWDSIDLINQQYTIEADYNKIGEDQDYFLSDEIIEALEQIQTSHDGLVFASPRTGEEMDTPRKQLAKLKADTGIEELTMHYFRHILVTALGEYGMAATSLSAALGHTRADTVDEVYRTINHLKGSQDAVQQIGTIINKDNDYE